MVDEELYNAYSTALRTNSELANQAVAALISELDGLSDAQLQVALNKAYSEIVNKFGASAAYVALEFYTASREAAAIESSCDAQAYFPSNQGALSKDVSSILERSISQEGLLSSLGGRAQQRVNEYADETLIMNSRTDPAHPKWALVPGIGACSWCCMIGGLGFQFNAEGTVARHSHCNCTPVVDFDTSNPSLKGYDPNGLAARYREAQKTALGGKSAWEAWNELSDEERENWRIKALEKTKATTSSKHYSAFDLWRREITLKEMATRDRDWLRKGTPTVVDFSLLSTKQKKLVTANEASAYSFLANNGFNLQVIPTDRRAPASIDLRFTKTNALWELKTLQSDSKRLRMKLAEGVSKWTRLKEAGIACGTPKIVLDNRNSKLPDSSALDVMRSEMEYQKQNNFDEALLITKESEILRIRI